MSNKLFRKGLVAAAIAGLATSVFAGVPAHAAGEIVIAPAAGTSYNTFADQTFSLVTSYAPGVVSPNVGQLKYKLTRAANKAVYAYAGTTSTGAPVSQTWTSDATVISASASLTAQNYLNLKVNGAAAADATNSVTVVAWQDSNNDGVVDSNEWQSTATVTFKKYSEVTATSSITAPLEGDVSATAALSFDGINNEELPAALAGGAFTKGDGQSILSAVETGAVLSFPTTDTVRATVANSFKVGQAVAIGATTITGGTSPTATVGASSTRVVTAATATYFEYTVSGAAITGNPTSVVADATPTSAVSNIAWSSTDKFKYSIATSALVKDQAVKFAPAFNGTAVGTAVTSLITARSVSALTAAVNASATAAAGTTANSTGSVAGTGTVATNKTFTAYAKTVDTATPPAAIAGKTVSYSVVATKLPATASAVTSSTATLTINGVTYTNQAALPGATGVAKLTGVTDANGKVAVTGSTTGYTIAGDATDNIVISFSAENFTAVLTVTEAAATAASASINYPVTFTGVQGLTGATSVVAGATATVTVKVNDQFGNAVADNKYAAFATVVPGARSGTGAAASTLTSPVTSQVVGGVATLALPDNGVGTGSNAWTLVLRAIDSTTGAYAARTYPVAITSTAAGTGFNAAADAATALTVNFVAAADLVPGKVTLATGSGANDVAVVTDSTGATVAGQYKATAAALATADFANYDGRNSQTAAPAGFVAGLGTAQSLAATVYSASTATYLGVAIPSASATYSLKGAQFSATIGGQEVDAIDSITVPSGTTVSLWSHLAGKQTVTVTSGAASATVVVTFPAPAATAGTTVNVVAPASATPGTTVAITVTVADKFGNAIGTVAGSGAASDPLFTLSISGIGAGSSQTTYDSTTVANRVALTDGTVTKYVTLGSSDNGTISISASYDADGTGTVKAAVTKTASVLVGSAAAKTVSAVAAVASAQTGAAVSVSATVKDASGAVVAGVPVTFSSTGNGYFQPTTATTDANGVATVKLVGNVAGANSVVATAGSVSAAAVTVTFGNSDAALSAVKVTTKKSRVTASWNFAGGKKIVVSVDGKRVKSVIASDDTADSYSFNVTGKGTHKVTVSVAGVVTDAISVKIAK